MAAWFSRLFTGQEGRDGALAINQQALLAGWRQLPEVDISRSHYRSRYVLVDVETAARSLKSDRLVSIAALALVDGLIDFQEAFHVVLAHDAPGADAAAGEASEANAPTAPNPALVIAGVPPVDALISFLSFAGKAPLVAYHSPLVGAMIERALVEHLGIVSAQPCIDLAWVLSDLFRDVSDVGDLSATQGGLDAWLAHFGIASIQRHNAVSDAYVIAKLLQIAIARAARKGFDSPGSLLELEKARRHLHQSG
ncbi:Exonuclease RNase T and DNA polymerase III [Candidatus Accumulibacter aalborgensis]|uniref:Exonuclease RNase T and DNA polymerase III n=1 Tax=Candidatus Accumulibacter aalborgensis TaxID=1860102 RepID=A0A1A8XLA7_9PROT|nr:3'-5' exonuclease [Candidatus Accumulibacter aalborgensis]SBT05456.1 Exonuclease RNase T and DNA polymerase III [Candidatus Accumulibacter aalborgensis]